MFIRFLLIVAFFSLQSCSNTPIGEKLENSFDTTESPIAPEKATKSKEQKNLKKIKNYKYNKSIKQLETNHE